MLLICDACKRKIGTAIIPTDIQPNRDGSIPKFKHYCSKCTDDTEEIKKERDKEFNEKEEEK